MHRNPIRWTIAFTAALSLGWSALCRADDAGQKYNLTLTVQSGEKWDFEVTNTSKTQTSVFSGVQQAQQISQSSQQHSKGSLEVLETKDGSLSAVRIHFAPDCSTTVSQNGQDQEIAFPLADKTVTIRQGDNGQVTTDAGELDQQTMAALSQYLLTDRSIYPKDAVAVGDEWDGATDQLRTEFQLGPNDDAKLKCKLLAIGHAGDRKTADVSLTAQISKADVATTIHLGGVAQLDLITGKPLQVDVVGKIDINGPVNANGQQFNVQGGGQLELHETVHLADADGGQTAAPAAPVSPLNPIGTATPAPANPGDDAQKFAGTFKNESLTVSLQPDGQGGWTGTITLGGQNMPATGKVDGGTLTGQFESGGTKFDFTATVDDGSMKLSSGGKDFNLKKDVVNPLAQ